MKYLLYYSFKKKHYYGIIIIRKEIFMKFTVIIPTYNDAESINETLESVVKQTYQNWELLISDDGSTDHTKEIVNKFIKKYNESRIKYFYHENQDQLNAILNVFPYITGDYIFVLHSDDLFYDESTLEKASKILQQENVDGIISSPVIVNENLQEIGTLKVRKYIRNDDTLALQLLWLGRNLYIDVAFHKYEIYTTKVKDNYLTWNTPFWLDLTDKPKMLNVKNVGFPFFKYRVFEGNYINNPLGKLNVINGELRTAINLMKYYHIPFHKIQYYLFRALNKLNLTYKPLYAKKESKNKAKIIEFILRKRYKNEYKNNLFLNNLLLFYKNYNNCKITIEKIDEDDFIYYGKDMRKFNKDLLNNNLSSIYFEIINKMKNGFQTIEVSNNKDYNKMINITKFLCIYPFITIVKKEKK